MNSKIIIALIIAPLFSVLPTSSFAQLRLNTLSNFRIGELPNSNAAAATTYYSDALLEYRHQFIDFGLRVEGYVSPNMKSLIQPRDNKFQKITQRFAQINWAWGNARIGNLYGLFGRGMIFRAFELPGFIYESSIAQKQHRVIRDVDGAKLAVNWRRFSITTLGGRIVNPLIAPDDKLRNFGNVNGGQFEANLGFGAAVGTAYLQHKTETVESKLSTYFAKWSADALLDRMSLNDFTFDIYSEYATDKGYAKLAALTPKDPHAFYFSATTTWKKTGASFEYKDYKDFNFEINDPPPVIRENQEKLLNRATHVLDAVSEKGAQLELFYSPTWFTRFTANFSRAIDERAVTGRPKFAENYLAFEYTGDKISSKFFVDSGKDELFSEIKRFTTGFLPDYSLMNDATIGLDIQWQYIRKVGNRGAFDYRIYNTYAAFKFQNWRALSLSISMERSNDPDLTDDLQVNKKEYFFNTSIGWRPMPQVNLLLFAGKRRGGTACDHGYCIELLEFNGMEFRVETQW